MLRLSLLTLVVLALSVYAWRDWYRALCALILMIAFVEHPDMPKTMLGIPGMNPWNLLLASIMMSWFFHRAAEKEHFDLPRQYTYLLLCYAAIIVVSFVRGYTDIGGIVRYNEFVGLPPPDKGGLLNDGLINAIKWAVPGLLLFTGARTRERKMLAVIAISGVTVLLGLQIIRWMPLSLLADGGALSDRALIVFDREIGYHRVDLAALMAGGFWAMMSFRAATSSYLLRMAFLGASMLVLLALALTGGRAGYFTWAALGMFFAFMRSKKYLLLAPLVAAAILVLVPAARERLMYGFDSQSEDMSDARYERVEEQGLMYGDVDLHAVTSGRALAWELVVEKIFQAPWFGYGQFAMQREGISQDLIETYGLGESFPHPHNAYLELLLDDGLIGAFPVLLFFYLVFRRGVRVLTDREHPFESAVAAASLAFIMAQLLASVGSQSFYPKSGTVVMWCAIGLQLRVFVERMAREQAAALTEKASPAAARTRTLSRPQPALRS